MAELLPVPVRVRRLSARLARLYPEGESELQTQSPLQLLVATILSAQCTDVRVNLVTPKLFERFPTVEAFANARLRDIERHIRTTGFFRVKAKNIRGCCRLIRDKHQGEVPNTIEELIELPGIGRKTANCILGGAFGTPGITVDTHVGRLSRRLGLTEQKNPVKVEADLMALIPRPQWTVFSRRLILHGRRVCFARKPECAVCTLSDLCPKVNVLGNVAPSEQTETRSE